MGKLDDKIALVTGGSSGIGLAAVKGQKSACYSQKKFYFSAVYWIAYHFQGVVNLQLNSVQ